MKRTFVSVFFVLATALVGALGCVREPNVYVLFAQKAQTAADLRHAITLRLPLVNQPVGAAIVCASPSMRVSAAKINEARVRVRDYDGEVRVLDLDGDGYPAGLVTQWPEGTAYNCGIASDSPIGSGAYFMWGEFTLFMVRVSEHAMKFRINEDSLMLNYPLAPGDRVALRKYSVPLEIERLLP
ncbi:MAG: hypothetical protein WC641_02250 [Patescibacteria group bacterium]